MTDRPTDHATRSVRIGRIYVRSTTMRLTILDYTGPKDDGVAVQSTGPYANHLHLAPDR